MKILVVDDERIILRGIARMIREHPDVEEVRTAAYYTSPGQMTLRFLSPGV